MNTHEYIMNKNEPTPFNRDSEIRGHCDQCHEDFYQDDYCEPYTCTSCEEGLWVGIPPHGHNCQAIYVDKLWTRIERLRNKVESTGELNHNEYKKLLSLTQYIVNEKEKFEMEAMIVGAKKYEVRV
jgi:hypothetical protein